MALTNVFENKVPPMVDVVGIWKPIPSYYERYTSLYYMSRGKELPLTTDVLTLIEEALNAVPSSNLEIKQGKSGSSLRVYGEKGEGCKIRLYKVSTTKGLVEFHRLGIDTVIPFIAFYKNVVTYLMGNFPDQFSFIELGKEPKAPTPTKWQAPARVPKYLKLVTTLPNVSSLPTLPEWSLQNKLDIPFREMSNTLPDPIVGIGELKLSIRVEDFSDDCRESCQCSCSINAPPSTPIESPDASPGGSQHGTPQSFFH